MKILYAPNGRKVDAEDQQEQQLLDNGYTHTKPEKKKKEKKVKKAAPKGKIVKK